MNEMSKRTEDVISSARIVFEDNENLDEKIMFLLRKTEELTEKISELEASKTEG